MTAPSMSAHADLLIGLIGSLGSMVLALITVIFWRLVVIPMGKITDTQSKLSEKLDQELGKVHKRIDEVAEELYTLKGEHRVLHKLGGEGVNG